MLRIQPVDATSQCQLFARGIRGAICWFNPGTLVLLRPGLSSAKPLLPNCLNQTRYPGQSQGQRICPLFAIRYNLSSYLQSIDQGNNLASNKARAHFTLSGYHFNPDDITRLLGIEPTSVDASGARSALDKPVISSWELSTETMTDNIDVYKMTEIIIKKIEPAKEKILQVIKSHNLSPRIDVVLVLSVDKGETCPDVGFGARTIRFLADIGAFINVDYQLSERI
jgi:hypothetical protein